MANRPPGTLSVAPRFWARMIARQARSGLTHREFCARHSLSIHQFRDWKYVRLRLRTPAERSLGSRPEPPPSPFVPLRLVESPPVRPDVVELVLLGGRVMRIPADLDPALLHRLVEAVEFRPC